MNVLRETEELAEMARAAGQPLHGELRMGVIPTIAPFLLPTMLPRLREQWPRAEALPARGDQPAQHAKRCTAASSIACLLALPFACGEVDMRAAVRRSAVCRLSRRRGAAQPASVAAAEIDENRLLLLEDGHCLKDHALSACNRPELRAHAAMMGTSLHTLVQMVDNGLGLTFVPEMAIEAGILAGTGVDAKPLGPITPTGASP